MAEANKYSKEMWEKTTIIKDMVHGYIKIPKPIIKEIIDSQQFQRLKDIEQTGMEALYPSATHKRFTHSLGVYHLAKRAFAEFSNNVKIYYPHIYSKVANIKVVKCEEIWLRWKILFELAALLHDCGHSPFSHTLEFIYDLPVDEDDQQKVLNKKLTEQMSPGFIDDFGKGIGKPHERMSSLYVKSSENGGFRDKIETLLRSYVEAYELSPVYDDYGVMQDDIEFMIRMIIGCRYNYEKKDSYKSQKEKYDTQEAEKWYIELQIRNCIIGMLNSQLDVDNLDYVVRDSKFSGYANHEVDLERLLSSFTIVSAVEVKEQKVFRNTEFNQCINLQSFRGNYIEGRLTGSSHICCKNKNIRAHGRIVLEDQAIKTEANQRIYQTTDDFSAEIDFTGDNDAKIEITAPKEKKQSCAYIHFKGRMEGILSGTIFTNDNGIETDKDKWIDKGELKIYFAYEQKCMSVLMSAVYNSNFEKKWIYAHHVSTFTNDFLYIYILRKYAEHIVESNKKELLNTLKEFLGKVQYQPIDGNKISDDTKKDMSRYRVNLAGDTKDNLYDIIMEKDSENLAATNNIIRRFMRISEIVKKDEYKEEFYRILRKCCLKGQEQALGQQTLDEAEEILKKYEKVCIGDEMQVLSDIMAMYNEPYQADGMLFYKTSDRDLLAAYKNLSIQIAMDKDTYADDYYKEFEESYNELIQRSYLKCMWKSQPEYEYYFSDWSYKERECLRNKLKCKDMPKTFGYLVLSDSVSEMTPFAEEFWKYLKEEHSFERFVCVPQQIRMKRFVDYEMYMRRGKRVLRLKDVGLFNDEREINDFFYFYYKQTEQKEFDVFEILAWLKGKVQEEIEEDGHDNQR